ncbi:MAG: Pycsar system effector family protein [Candidatus Aenigmarchaeota archaeon]
MGKHKGLEELKDTPHLLREILKFQTSNNMLADNKANFILVISGLVMTFAASIIANPDFLTFSLPSQIGFIVLTAGMVITVLVAITVVCPRGTQKAPAGGKGSNDLFYYGRFKKYSVEAYSKELEKAVNDPKKAVRAFAEASYSLGKIVDQKFRYIRISMIVLRYFIIIGLFLILVGWIF